MATLDVSIIVPCYNEESHLQKSFEAIFELLSKTRYSFEMIFVDDCSNDGTREIIRQIAQGFPNIQFLFHEKNSGRGGAFLDGIPLAEGKYIGYLDIDLEVSCIFLVPVLTELDKNSDAVIVKRHYSIQPDLSFIIRHFLSLGYKFLVRSLLKIPIMDTESGFKFFKRDVLLALAPLTSNKHWFFDTEIMTFAFYIGYKIKEVDGLFMRRPDKKSTVRVFRDTLLYFKELYRFKKRLDLLERPS
ncbi:MAG: glycosyltransferase [Bacteroidetes bacterium]|nr:glycosyltransferase [Bacteroidota bacterium]